LTEGIYVRLDFGSGNFFMDYPHYFFEKKSLTSCGLVFWRRSVVRKNKVINIMKMLIYNMTQKRHIVMRKRVGAKK